MARRPTDLVPTGCRSSGAAFLVPMITSKWAGIKEQAVLALLRVRCSTVEEGDPAVSMAPGMA